MTQDNNPRVRGFAKMDPDVRRKLASIGGKRAHEKGRAHKFNSKTGAKAGTAGGVMVSRNKRHMREIGRIGGKVSAERRRASNEGSGA